LDTNVIVSALMVPAGQEAFVLLLALRGYIELFLSAPILAEYEEVLHRPRLKLQLREVETALENIRAKGVTVHPTKTVSISVHESDNFRDDYGVTKIVNARELLERLRYV
jgi:putative PIN family toxin of toxin-antitoxin system